MKMKTLVLALSLLLLGGLAQAQSTTASTVLSNISITGTASGFMGASGTQPASILGADFQVSQAVSVGYEQVQISALNTNYDFGVVNYGVPLSSLLGKTLTSKLTFNASDVSVTFTGGVGKMLTSATTSTPANSHIAETAGVFLHIPVSANLSFQVLGAQWIHGVSNGVVTAPSTAALSSGLSISF